MHLNSHHSQSWGPTVSLLNSSSLFLLPNGCRLSTYPAFFFFPAFVSHPLAPSLFSLDLASTSPTTSSFWLDLWPTVSLVFIHWQVSVYFARIFAPVNQVLFCYLVFTRKNMALTKTMTKIRTQQNEHWFKSSNCTENLKNEIRFYFPKD